MPVPKPFRAAARLAVPLFLTLAFAPAVRAGDDAHMKMMKSSSGDLAKVADRIATEVAQVKPGQLVLVSGEARTMSLLSELRLAVARQGGAALVTTYVEKDGLRLYTEVPEAMDASRMAWDTKLAALADLVISADSSDHPGLLRTVPAARLAAAAKAGMTADQLMRSRKVARVSIGNGLYPTDATAKELGLNRKELEKLFWSAMAVPAADLARDGDAVKRALASGKEVRVTGPNGTDLTFSVEGRRTFVSSGVITADTREQPDISTWLPAGEVYVTPVKGTAKGKLVVDRQPYSGGFIEKLTFTVEAGKVVSHTAKASALYDHFKEQWNAAPEGKEAFGVLDIGVNRGAVVKGKTVASYIPAGNVSLGFGSNLWAGGDVDISYGFFALMSGLTVTVDGKALVERGVLKTAAPTM